MVECCQKRRHRDCKHRQGQDFGEAAVDLVGVLHCEPLNKTIGGSFQILLKAFGGEIRFRQRPRVDFAAIGEEGVTSNT